MARYHRIAPRLWRKMDREKWSSDARLLGMYLLTCDHRTTEGLYVLTKRYMEADLAWPEERVTQTLSELLGNGFVRYDEAVSVILIPSALEFQPPENPNQAKGAIRALDNIPETELIDEWIGLAELFSDHLRKLIPKGLPKRFRNRYPNPFETSSSNSSSISNSNSNVKPTNVGLTKTNVEQKNAMLDTHSQHTTVVELFAYWQQQCGHPRAKLDSDRCRKIEARLNSGRTPQEIREAIDGAAREAYVDESGVKHDDIELICRNERKLKLFMERATAQPQSKGEAVEAEKLAGIRKFAGTDDFVEGSAEEITDAEIAA